MTEYPTYCPISGDQTKEELTDGDYREIKCPTCGIYRISSSLEVALSNNPKINTREKAVISHYIRQKNEAGEHPFFSGDLIDRIVEELSLPGLAAQIDNLILYLGQNTSIGERSPFSRPALKAVAGALDNRNVSFVCQYLFDQGYILHDHQNLYFTNEQASLGLNMKGWERFYELEKGKVDRCLAFMAMPFGDARLDEIYLKWFKPACKAVGFELRRVDERPEAGIINNKMMVDIRKSRFIIAELTTENRGVYWEAGFAEGLNRPVIYTCDEQYKNETPLHFDIRQHHTVFWTDTNLLDAAKRLVITIQATVPEAKLIDVDEIQW